MRIIYSLIGLAILFGIVIQIVISETVVRYNFDAFLYEQYSSDSKSIRYSRTEEKEWKNLTALCIKKQLKDKAMLCTRGKGSWWAFPSANYKVGNGLSYQLITGENCLPAKTIESLQPIGEIKTKMRDVVVLYTEPHFSSSDTTVTGRVGVLDAKSMVFFGNKPWIVEADRSEVEEIRICLSPVRKDKSVCVFPMLDAALGVTTGNKRFTEVENCSQVVGITTLEVETCYDEGVYPMLFDHEDFSITNMNKLCRSDSSGDVSLPFRNKLVKLMEIWEGRINGELESQESIAIPTEAVLKFRLLWNVVDVFKRACPLVTTEYLSLLRNVFLQHIREVWLTYPNTMGDVDTDFRYASGYVDACVKILTDQLSIPIAERKRLSIPCSPMDPADRMEFDVAERDALDEMLEGDTYDSVIEHIWLILNFVAPHCNYINDFKGNEWSDLVQIFRTHFLIPLQDQWRKPKVWAQYYVSMFSGYDLAVQRSNIIQCIQGAILKTPSFDPIGRTNIFDTRGNDKFQRSKIDKRSKASRLRGEPGGL